MECSDASVFLDKFGDEMRRLGNISKTRSGRQWQRLTGVGKWRLIWEEVRVPTKVEKATLKMGTGWGTGGTRAQVGGCF